jgi:anthranilate synthase component I
VKPPFDIAGDLDTPVSAFAKLGAFDPRFLLESVEGGERLARYSFIGFGKCLEVKLDAAGLTVGTAKLPRPANKAELLDALRKALAAAPKPLPEMAGVPLAGGLVGYSSYDVVRYFERIPSRARVDNPVPDLHYVAPESMLVFDHLTRGIALLHAGSEAERQALRREVIKALRGGLPNYVAGVQGEYSPAVGSLSRDEYMAGVKRTQEYIAAGDVYQLVLASRFSGRHSLDPFEAYRALGLINPSPYMYYCKLGDVTVVGSSPEALVKVNAAGEAQL